MKNIIVYFILILMPFIAYPQDDVCSYCDGKSVVKCHNCEGNGCIECNSTGFTICPFKTDYPLFHPEKSDKDTDGSKHKHGYSNNKNCSEYHPLNNPDLVDNSAEIVKVENQLAYLKNKKLTCYLCNGTGKVPGSYCFSCRGTGMEKRGYPSPQFYPCVLCGGRGRKDSSCPECSQTDFAISFNEGYLKSLKETHGMTRKTANFYYEYQNDMTRMRIEDQRAIDDIANSYLNNSDRTSYNTNTSSSSCSICGGSGMDPFAWEDPGHTPYAGGYTNTQGNDCPYCDKFTWHQHKYCPKCNADKY